MYVDAKTLPEKRKKETDRQIEMRERDWERDNRDKREREMRQRGKERERERDGILFLNTYKPTTHSTFYVVMDVIVISPSKCLSHVFPLITIFQ